MGQLERKKESSSSSQPAYKIKLVRVDDELTPEAEKLPKKRQKNKNRRLLKKKVLIPMLAVIIAVGAGAFWQVKSEAKSPIPDSVKSSVTFPLYYPTDTPEGYSLDEASIKNFEGSIFYNLNNASGKKPIIISQQTLPKGFDPKSMFGHTPPPASITSLGTMYDLSYKEQSRFMVAAKESLIFVASTGAKVDGGQTKQIIEGLKLSK